ncbi:TPA: hypothetical protein ACHVWS_005543 [Klebsiella pneumoniae]
MGIGSWFGLNKNEFVIGGVKTKLPETDDQTMDLAAQLARQLGSKLPTEQDVYWFVARLRLIIRLVGCWVIFLSVCLRWSMKVVGQKTHMWAGRTLASHTFLKM